MVTVQALIACATRKPGSKPPKMPEDKHWDDEAILRGFRRGLKPLKIPR